MGKLSDVFLNLLGNTLQGSQGTPAALEERNRLNADNSRSNLATLATLNQNYNSHPSDFVGPQNQGTLRPSNSDLTSIGVPQGTTFEPVSKSSTFVVPNTKTGKLDSQTIPIPRGSTVQEVNPFSGVMLGQAKSYLDQANVFEKNANDNLTQINGLVGKLDPGIAKGVMQSLAQGMLPDNLTSFFKDPNLASQIQQMTSTYKQNKAQAQQYRQLGTSMFGGGGGAGAAQVAPAGQTSPSNARPPMPQGFFSKIPQGMMPVFNRATNSYGAIPQANFNPMLYEQVQQPTGAPQ